MITTCNFTISLDFRFRPMCFYIINILTIIFHPWRLENVFESLRKKKRKTKLIFFLFLLDRLENRKLFLLFLARTAVYCISFLQCSAWCSICHYFWLSGMKNERKSTDTTSWKAIAFGHGFIFAEIYRPAFLRVSTFKNF